MKSLRAIFDHHDGHGLNESIALTSDDCDHEKGGGAAHYYEAFIRRENDPLNTREVLSVQFQHGPRDVEGSTPGVTENVLLAILIDRMRCFNDGPYRCRENALVLTHLEEALHWMKARADERARRGVLGRNEK